MSNQPKIVTVIGSTKFINEMSVIGWEYEKIGYIAFTPRLLPLSYIMKREHVAESEGVKEIIDKTYLKKVEMADLVFVCNKNGYIGESTSKELVHAINHNIPIEYLEEMK